MTDTGDSVKIKFKGATTLKGHSSTYDAYVEDTRVGRVGKLTDGTWQAYGVKGKKIGEPVKTRTAAGALIVEQPFTEPGLTVVTVDAPDPARPKTPEAKVAETTFVTDKVGEPEDPAPEYEAPANPDAEEEIEEVVDDEIETTPLVPSAARADGEDIEMSDRMHDTYESIDAPTAFPATHETDVTPSQEQPVPAAPAMTPSDAPASRPSLWARTKAWFRGA